MSENRENMALSGPSSTPSGGKSLASSTQLQQLRQLQGQLASMIRESKHNVSDESQRSTVPLTSAVCDIDSSHRSTSSAGSGDLKTDIESGLGFFSSSSASTIDNRPAGGNTQGASLAVARASVVPFASASAAKVSPLETVPLSDKKPDPIKDSDTVATAADSKTEDSRVRRRTRSVTSLAGQSMRLRRRSSGTLQRINIFRSKKDPVVSGGPGGQLHNYDFLQKEENKEEGSLRPGAKWWHGVFLFSVMSMLACIITLWAPYPIGARMPTETIAQMPWSNGCMGVSSCICPRETICADDLISMIFLTISRSSAWFDYPLYMLLFMSKANNLNNFLQKTALRCWINFSDYHKVHSLFGLVVAIESTSHSFFHLLRWGRRNNDIRLLWTHTTGITGFIALIFAPFIVLPMTVPFLKKRMPFEWRKGLHYFSILWGVALMYHAPERIFWLIGVPIFIYTMDKFVELFSKTFLIESAHFQRLGDTSCIISFENPPGFGKQNSAYVYLMLPWLSKYQFHAFTVFPSTQPNHSSICIYKSGDWTGALMKHITTPAHKPAFVAGPFLSPFSSPAMDSENLVAVASGIGVTPAISLIKQYSSTSRRLNLVWICREAGLVEHFLTNVEFGGYGYTLIYYTGKRSIVLSDDLPPNVFIFNGRPNLERTISGIIFSIVSGEGLPEELYDNHRVVSKAPAEMRTRLLLEKALSIYSMDQLFDYTVKASNLHDDELEPPLMAANYQGVLSTMKHLLGDDCESVTDKLTRNFEKINIDGSCLLNRQEFEDFMRLMLEEADTEEISTMASVKLGLERMSTCKNLFDSGAGRLPLGDEFGVKDYLQGDGKFSANNWNMLYCGGSEAVLSQLKTYKRKYGIGLSVEKFDW